MDLQELYRDIWRNSEKDIPISYIHKNIKDIEGDYYKPIIETLNNWDFNEPNLCSILSVQNGCGKSHLASGLLKLFVKYKVNEKIELLRKEPDNFTDDEIPNNIRENFKLKIGFIPERIFLRKIRDGYKEKYFSEQDLYNEYCRYNLLVLDDVFSSKETNQEFSRRAILDLINDRYEFYNRPTIITSNLTLQEIAGIDTRLSSRMNNSMLIQINTKLTDYRINH